MSTTIVLELLGGFLAASVALWFVALRRPFVAEVLSRRLASLPPFLAGYALQPGRLASLGLLVLRLSVGVMMIHHGQDKLADPQSFATNYVAALHLPFPLFMAYAAGYAEIIGSWLLIFGLFTPFGALALSGTMAVAGYHHILTSGLNIYVLELVVLYLGGSLGLLLLGPGRFSFDAGIAHELLQDDDSADGEELASSAALRPIPLPVNGR